MADYNPDPVAPRLSGGLLSNSAEDLLTRHGTGSLGHRVNESFGSSFTSGSPSHRVIILTRRETRHFPVFEKNAQMQNVRLKCWNDKSHCQVSVVGLKSLDVSPCNELLLLPMIIKNSLTWEYFFVTPLYISRHLEFIRPIEHGHRVNWVSGSLDSRVTGSLGHKCDPVPCLLLTISISCCRWTRATRYTSRA